METPRKHPAHPSPLDRHNQSTIVFLTVCSKDRKRILASPDCVAVIIQAWREATSWLVGRYVVMPNHIHLFCAPAVFPSQPLKQWVRYWKNVASRNWPRHQEQPIWQRDFWDTQLRRPESYDSKWQYVADNPVRAGLRNDATQWPHQGELNILPW
jgi:putative transposase